MVVENEPFSLNNDGNIGIFNITKLGNKLMRGDANKKGNGVS